MAGPDTNYRSGPIIGFRLERANAAQRQQLRAADHIGIIFQSLNLIPYLDLIDNVELPADLVQYGAKRQTDRPPNCWIVLGCLRECIAENPIN